MSAVGRPQKRKASQADTDRFGNRTNIIPNQNIEFKTFLDKKKLNFQIRVILKGEVRVLWQEVRVFLFLVSDLG